MEGKIKQIAGVIARKVAAGGVMNVDDTAEMIAATIKLSMPDILEEFSTIEEKAYTKLLQQAQSLRVGSKEYLEVGYKLSLLKKRKATANRAANNVRREDNYSRLRHFIVDDYDPAIIAAFEAIPETKPEPQKVYSTSK